MVFNNKEYVLMSMGVICSGRERMEGLVMDREAWCAAVHGITKSWTWCTDWTELNTEKAKNNPLHAMLPSQNSFFRHWRIKRICFIHSSCVYQVPTMGQEGTVGNTKIVQHCRWVNKNGSVQCNRISVTHLNSGTCTKRLDKSKQTEDTPIFSPPYKEASSGICKTPEATYPKN